MLIAPHVKPVLRHITSMLLMLIWELQSAKVSNDNAAYEIDRVSGALVTCNEISLKTIASRSA